MWDYSLTKWDYRLLLLLSCPSHNFFPLAGACLSPLCHRLLAMWDYSLAMWDYSLAMRDYLLAMSDYSLAMWDYALAMWDYALTM